MSETRDSAPAAPAAGSQESRPAAAAPGAAPPPRRRARGPDGFDPDAWMVTFSDLLTLLMTFFVLMFASQDPVPPEKLQQAFGQSTGVFGLFRTGFLERIVAVPQRDLSQDLVQVFLNEIGALDIEVTQEARGLVVTLPTDAYFAPGQARLDQRARTRIDKLAAYLAATRHRIRVEGHTDDRERAAPPYPGRWELSVARADRVLQRLLAQHIDERRLALAGYGPSRPRVANTSGTARALNRRVEIVILNRRTAPGAP
jgi:chemotaxis protein MotB